MSLLKESGMLIDGKPNLSKELSIKYSTKNAHKNLPLNYVCELIEEMLQSKQEAYLKLQWCE